MLCEKKINPIAAAEAAVQCLQPIALASVARVNTPVWPATPRPRAMLKEAASTLRTNAVKLRIADNLLSAMLLEFLVMVNKAARQG